MDSGFRRSDTLENAAFALRGLRLGCSALRQSMIESLNKHIRGLRAHNDKTVVQDETGDALNAHFVGEGDFALDEIAIGAFAEQIADKLRV